MQSSIVLIWIGALLVVGGVLFTASRALSRGRLSDATPRGVRNDTLEPARPAGGFGLKANWPGLALIALGGILLLIGASL